MQENTLPFISFLTLFLFIFLTNMSNITLRTTQSSDSGFSLRSVYIFILSLQICVQKQ